MPSFHRFVTSLAAATLLLSGCSFSYSAGSKPPSQSGDSDASKAGKGKPAKGKPAKGKPADGESSKSSGRTTVADV